MTAPRRRRSADSADDNVYTNLMARRNHIDESLHEGWSVIVHGQARTISDPAELEQARSLGIEPWPGAERKLYVRVGTDALTGRRIRTRA